jgi:hypothetical protein
MRMVVDSIVADSARGFSRGFNMATGPFQVTLPCSNSIFRRLKKKKQAAHGKDFAPDETNSS